jgi:hypothetical protein
MASPLRLHPRDKRAEKAHEGGIAKAGPRESYSTDQQLLRSAHAQSYAAQRGSLGSAQPRECYARGHSTTERDDGDSWRIGRLPARN